jgi:hypothetical protein
MMGGFGVTRWVVTPAERKKMSGRNPIDRTGVQRYGLVVLELWRTPDKVERHRKVSAKLPCHSTALRARY